MFSHLFKKAVNKHTPKGDTLCVEGSNAELLESLLSDVDPKNQDRIRDSLIQQMRKDGFSEETIGLM